MAELGTYKTPRTSIELEHFDALLDSLGFPMKSLEPHEQGMKNGPENFEKPYRIGFWKNPCLIRAFKSLDGFG